MRRSLLVSLLMILLNTSAYAGLIKGRVIDAANKQPLDYVNVALLEEGSNVPVSGATTDTEGYFTFPKLKNGVYSLQISFIGYSPITLPIRLTEKNSEIDVKNIALAEVSKKLAEVQVMGQRSQMRFEVDKKVFSVDQNIASAGGSASEVLENIPSVDVDVEGNISLRNDANVEVWINGRPSGLSADNRAQILQQMPAESIENIEVITNPSSKFSAEGSAGIINLVLKKNRKAGYYGSVSAGGDTWGGYNASASINYNSSAIDAYASLGLRQMRFNINSETNRESWMMGEEPSDTTFLQQINEGNMRGGGYFGRAGFNYHMTEKDDLGFNFSAMSGGRDMAGTLSSYDATQALTRTRLSSDDSSHKMVDLGVDYTHQFREGSDLRALVTYNHMKRESYEYFEQTSYLPAQPFSTQVQEEGAPMDRWEFQLDYTNQINDQYKLEAGYKGNLMTQESEINRWENAQLVETSPFDYNTNKQALYATFTGKIENFNFQAGLRSEYLNYQIEDLGEGYEPFSKNYLDLFPSLFLSYSLPKGNELQVNYTSRINSPHGRLLSPFRNLMDSTSISYGNPDLDPEYTNSFELNYIKNWEKHTLSASLYYRTTDGVIQNVQYYDAPTLYSTYENITQSQRAGMELVAKNRLFSFIDLTTTANAYYYKLDGFNYTFDEGGASGTVNYAGSNNFSWDVRMMAAFVLPAGISAQVTGGYRSRSIIVQGESEPTYSLDAGIRKSFLSRKLNVSLSCRDLLNSRMRRSTTWGENFYQTSKMQFGGRSAMLSISYLFGNGQSHSKPTRNQQDTESSFDSEMMEF